MALVISAGAATVACKQPDPPPRKLPVAVRWVPAHSGSTELQGGPELLASFTPGQRNGGPDPVAPGTVRLSRGDGPVQRSVTGWLIGATSSAAYALRRDGDDVSVHEVPLAGPETQLGKLVVSGEDWDLPSATVVKNGAMIVVEADSVLHIIERSGVRRIALENGESAALYGNPMGPEVFAIVARWSTSDGEKEPMGQRLLMVDVAAQRTMWESPRNALPRAESAATFTADGTGVLIMLGDDVVRFDLASGQRATHWTGASLFENGLIASNGRHYASTRQLGTSHASFIDPTCVLNYFGEQLLRKQTWEEKVTSYPGFCANGPSFTFVGDELWIAPPS